MTEFLVLTLVLGLFTSFQNWRKGMLLCVAVGFLSDPVRKVIPGQPVYFVVLVGVFVAVVIAGFFSQYGRFRFKHLGSLSQALKIPASLFFLWLGFAALVSLVRYHSPVLAGIGLLSYLAPIPAFFVAFYYGLHPRNIIRFIQVYVVCSLVMLSGIYLSYFGVDWPVLKEVGSGVQIYVAGGILDAFPGFLRSTEIAAWHSAAAICLLLVLVVSGTIRWPKILVAAIILLLLGAGLMTGRRKMLMEVVIFAGFYGALLTWFQRGAGRVVVIGILMAAILGTAGVFGLRDSTSVVRLNPYLQRGVTVFGDAEDRFTKLGLSSVRWAIQGYGILGGGLGVASQGGQHFGGGAVRFGGAGEGGLGKITAELGVPGLVLVLWMMVNLCRYLWHLVYLLSRKKSQLVPLAYGFVAFLAANIPLFIVATQVFGDLFVLLLLGWICGFSTAIYRLLLSVEPHGKKVIMEQGVPLVGTEHTINKI